MIHNSKHGITLLELILAIGMLSIVAVILFPIFAGYLRQAELKDTSKHLLGVLRRAQQFSQSQEGNDSWVVALWNVTSTDYFELYPSSTPTSKETFFFQSNIVFTDDTVPTSSVLKIKFEKFTGKGWYATSSDFINETKTFDLSLKNNPESKVIIEVSKEGKIAINQESDSDNDGVPDSSDNCPYWANPDQFLPSWSYPLGGLIPGDVDCDGFTTQAEQYMGTDPFKACPATSTANDESPDPWPPDFDDNGEVQIDDVTAVNSRLWAEVGDANYSPRYELASQDGTIQTDDFTKVNSMFGKKCTK